MFKINSTNLRGCQKWHPQSSQRGTSLLELALLLPLILLIIFGSLDVVNALRLKARISAQVRTLALAAYQDCTVLPNADQLGCLQDIISANSYLLNSLLRGARAHVGILHFDGASATPVTNVNSPSPSPITPGRSKINFSAYGITNSSERSMLLSHDFLAYAEIEAPFNPFLAPLAKYFSPGGFFYASSMV